MNFGLTPEQFQILDQLVIQPLKKQGCQVYIFGSRTTSKFHSHSDVDVLFSVPPTSKLASGLLSQIHEDIEESRFPFKVDLVNEKELAASYRHSVLSSRVAV